jgi:hypothetical protein
VIAAQFSGARQNPPPNRAELERRAQELHEQSRTADRAQADVRKVLGAAERAAHEHFAGNGKQAG